MSGSVFVILAAVLLLSVASLGLADGFISHAASTTGSISTLHPDVAFTAISTDDPGSSLDPGYDKHVASCSGLIDTLGIARVTVTNGYPSYTCTFTVTAQNTGDQPVQRTEPVIILPPDSQSALTVWVSGGEACGVLMPGETDVESFSVHVEQPARMNAQYFFSIHKRFAEVVQATVGFWSSWDSHDSFTQTEIEGWLVQIAADSVWLDATTIEQMEQVLDGRSGKNSTPQTRFLAHYLATRLNARGGTLCSITTHDVTEYDPDNYLGLADPANASLSEIIAAIESKYQAGNMPTNKQYEIMKEICDALNNLFA